jgi:hypothetical protein
MTALIDIGIAIGISLSLLKGVDFLIRPSQREQIQRFFEELTLWIDDLSVKTISVRLKEPGIQAFIMVCAFLSWVVFVSICFLPYYFLPEDAFQPLSLLLPLDVGSMVQLYWVAMGLAFLGLWLLWKWPVSIIVSWAIASGNRRKILGRGFFLAASSWAIVVLFIFLLDTVVNFHLESMVVIAMVPVNGLFIAGYSMAIACGIAGDIAGDKRSLLVKAFLATSKGLLWRLIEYQKGVVGALVLLATIGLTLTRLLI